MGFQSLNSFITFILLNRKMQNVQNVSWGESPSVRCKIQKSRPGLLFTPFGPAFHLMSPEACITKQGQHIQDIFSLADFTKPNIGCPDNQYYEGVY